MAQHTILSYKVNHKNQQVLTNARSFYVYAQMFSFYLT